MKRDLSKVYLGLSIFTLVLMFWTLFFPVHLVQMWNLEFDCLWIPTGILILFLPLFGIAKIATSREDWNMNYWIGIVLNLTTMLFIFRHLKIEWL